MDFKSLNIPCPYDGENLSNWMFNPSSTHVTGTGLQRYFVFQLFQRAMSVFTYDLPEKINPYYFKWNLWMRGYIAVGNTEQYGVIAQWGTLKGRDLYYYPKYVLVSNPALKKNFKYTDGLEYFSWEIGNPKNGCEVLNLNGTFSGIWKTCNLYADRLAIILQSWATNCKKSVAADFYGVKDQAQAKAMKKATDLAHAGEMEIFIDRSLFNDDGSLNVASFQHNMPYLSTDLLNDFVTTVHEFDTEIGLNNSNTQKRERLNSAEVYSNNEEVKSKIEMWLEDLQKTCRKLKTVHGIDLWIDLRYKNKEVNNNESEL